MKNTVILIMILILSSISFKTYCQTDNIPWDYELPADKKEIWQPLFDEWMDNDYYICLKQFNLKMNCASCTNIYVDVAITVGADGKCQAVDVLTENVCAASAPEKLMECFLKYFKALAYPDALKSMKFKVRLGTGLKC